MDMLYSKFGFNGTAKYGLLRNAVLEHLDFAQFAIYGSSSTYEELKRTVKVFVAGCDSFKAARSASRSVAITQDRRDIG